MGTLQAQVIYMYSEKLDDGHTVNKPIVTILVGFCKIWLSDTNNRVLSHCWYCPTASQHKVENTDEYVNKPRIGPVAVFIVFESNIALLEAGPLLVYMVAYRFYCVIDVAF